MDRRSSDCNIKYHIIPWQSSCLINEHCCFLADCATVGGTGDVKILPFDCWVTNLSIIIDFNNDLVNNQFFFYKYLVSNLLELDSGSAQSQITIKDLQSFRISFPPLPIQTQIASILNSLNNKINLLARQIKTLEQITQTLFSQWFVEEAEIQSEKQLLLEDLIDSVSITHPFPSDKIVFLNTSDIYLGNVLLHDSTEVKTLPGQAKKSIRKHDILFSEIRPANGRYAYVDFDAVNYVVSTKLMVLRSKNVLSQAFIYFYLTHLQTVSWLQVLAESRSGTFPLYCQRTKVFCQFITTFPVTLLSLIQN